MKNNLKALGMFLILVIFMVGCDENNDQSNNLNEQVRALIAQFDLTGDPSIGRNLPDIEDPVAQLGMLLFFTKALGGDMDSACVTCHHPVLGGGDDLSLPIGIGANSPDLLGPGRDNPEMEFTVPRNAPTTFNMAMWDSVLFFDGRVESLGKTPGDNGDDGQGIRTPDTPFGMADPEATSTVTEAQALFPVTSAEEMRGFSFEAGNSNQDVRDHLAGRIGNYGAGMGELPVNNWLPLFQSAYNSNAGAEDLVTYANIALAIAEYERSQVFVDTPWRAYVQGDDSAISQSAKRGAVLFFSPVNEGGADCVSCHFGDFFTDELFYVLAIPQVGPGKGDGPHGDDDFGRFRETGDNDDLYAQRTPTLLNVTATGPWGHSGAYTTLEGIVRHHLNPVKAIENYDFSQLSPLVETENSVENTDAALAKLLVNRQTGVPTVQDVELSNSQVNDIISFLHTLTDPCVEDRDCLAPWIPDDSDPDPDNMRLNAVDDMGNPL